MVGHVRITSLIWPSARMAQKLASASWDGTAKVWDLSTGHEIVTFSHHPNTAWITSIAFSPDGSRGAYTGSDDDFVRAWDAATGF